LACSKYFSSFLEELAGNFQDYGDGKFDLADEDSDDDNWLTCIYSHTMSHVLLKPFCNHQLSSWAQDGASTSDFWLQVALQAESFQDLQAAGPRPGTASRREAAGLQSQRALGTARGCCEGGTPPRKWR